MHDQKLIMWTVIMCIVWTWWSAYMLGAWHLHIA